MARIKVISKVTAFVTRPINGQAELLLFRHPLAGIQVPAGTVELGEPLEAAVLREAAEETGLSQLRLLRHLGHTRDELPQNQRLVLRMTKVFDAPSFDASSEGYGLTRGSPVQVTGRVGDFTAIVCEALDWRRDPPVRHKNVSGYVRTSLLTAHGERHFFHLTTDEQTPGSWNVFSDGLTFHLFWVPLQPKPSLNVYQQGWLDYVYQDLLSHYD